MADISIAEVRAKYPQYKDMTDQDLADALHAKFYSDMPKDQFYKKIGLGNAAQASAPAQPDQSNGLMPYVKAAGEGAGKFARAALQGASDVPYLFADAATQAANLGSGAINKVAGTQIPQLQYPSTLRNQALDKVFPTDKNLLDKIGSGATRLTANVPTMVGLSKAVPELASLGQNVPLQVSSAVTGGAAGGAAQHYFPNDPLIQVAAQLGGGAVGAGLHQMASNYAERPVVPTEDQLKATATAAYQTADDSGLILKPEAMQRLVKSVQDDLSMYGMDQDIHPDVTAAFKRLQSATGENISLKGLDLLRQVARSAGESIKPSEKAMSGMMVDKIDDFLNDLKPADVLQGNAEEGVAALNKARDYWSAMRKSETIQTVLDNAELDAGATNSGGNLQNKIRQGIAAILKNPKKARGFTADEQAVMEQIAKGTITQNTLRTVGRLAPSSNSWLSPLLGAIGFGAGGYPGGLGGVALGQMIPTVGSAAKAGATSLTQNAVTGLQEMIRAGAARPLDAMELAAPSPQLSPLAPPMILPFTKSNPPAIPPFDAQPPFGRSSIANEPQDKRRRRTP